MKKEKYIHAVDLDDETRKQFDSCCEHDFVVESALMPDAHSGYVAPIGSVLVTRDVVVPAWVGYDIGCGMIAVQFNGGENLLERVKKNSQEIYDKVVLRVPMGTGKVNHIQDVSQKTKGEFKKLFEKFKLGAYDDEVLRFIKNKALSHLGSLGSGNHFIELCECENQVWLVIHSGSRGVGHTVATKYMKKSSGKEKGYEETHPLELHSQLGKEYMNVLEFGLEFALLNRLEMAYTIRDVIKEVLGNENITFDMWVNKNHNHAVMVSDEEMENGVSIFDSDLSNLKIVHRKGATPAEKGERGVIPANMRDGSYLVEGLGNPEFLNSSSHGAGRVYSRRQAKENISQEEFEKSMQGIVGTLDERVRDEAPQAYKNISSVMKAQEESVKVLKHLKPLINWKGL